MLFDQIASNRRKTIFLFIIFFLVFELVGGAIGYFSFNGDLISGTVLATGIGLIYALITVWNSESIIMRMNHARQIQTKADYPLLWNVIEELIIVARLPMPKIYIIQSSTPNAFATGLSYEKGAVAVTTGLLEKLNREELKGVLAHELAHIKSHDAKLQCIALALVSAIVFMSQISLRVRLFRRNNRDNGLFILISLVIAVLAPFVITIIQLAISRNREFLADSVGAEMTRNPGALASALQKISEDPGELDVPDAVSGIYFESPVKKVRSSLFSTHPPTKERIKRLLEM